MDPKQQLQKIIKDLETKNFRDKEAKGLIETIGQKISEQLAPLFEAHSKTITDAVGKAVQAPTVNIPETQFPEQVAPVVNVPAPIVNIPAPVVNIPAPIINIPETVFPEYPAFPEDFALRGVDKNRPLPVMMMDIKGKPMQFPIGGGGMGGGKADFFTIVGIQNTIGVVTINPDGTPTYTTASGSSGGSTQSIDSSGNPYSQANPLPVVFGSSGTSASVIVDSTGVAYSGSNPLPTTASVTLSAAVGQGDGATALRVIQAGDSVSSVVVNSGTITTVTSITNSVSAALVDSSGVAYSGSNPLPTTASVSLTLPSGPGDGATATRFIQAGDTVSSTNVLSFNGNTPATGLNETNAGVLRVVQMTDSVNSVVVNSGTITTVTGITNSVAVVALDRDGNPLTTGPIGNGDQATALRVVHAGDAVVSVVVNSGTITTVTGITNTVGVVTINPDGSPTYAGTGGGGTQYAEGATASTFTGNMFMWESTDQAAQVVTTANPLPVTLATKLDAVNDSITVYAASGTNFSTNLVTFNGNAPAVGNNETNSGVLRTVLMTDSVSSVVVNSGTITAVTGITNTVNVRLDTPDGIVTSANPFPVTLAGGGLDSTFVYQARTTNPTAVTDGADVRPKADKLGRALVRPLQVRDLVKTAYATLSTGTETTLLAGVAGAFLDPILITGTNTSTAAIQVDLRAVTAGNIVMTWMIPASTGPVGLALPVGWPQDATGNNWTVDMGDFTNTTLYFSALFTQEL